MSYDSPPTQRIITTFLRERFPFLHYNTTQYSVVLESDATLAANPLVKFLPRETVPISKKTGNPVCIHLPDVGHSLYVSEKFFSLEN